MTDDRDLIAYERIGRARTFFEMIEEALVLGLADRALHLAKNRDQGVRACL